MKGNIVAADADTVTPLDGEDGNVTGIAEQFPNVSEEDYDTRGQTTVATRPGYRFVPSDDSLPIVTSKGVKMTQEQADTVVKESRGRVRIVTDEKKED